MGLTIRWDITKKCNLKCKHCSAYNDTLEPCDIQLSSKEIAFVMEKISHEKIDLIKLSGGEPFLRDDLSEIIDEAYIRNLPIGITTNGTIPLNDKIEKQVICGKLKYIAISLDSDNDSVNSILRPAHTVELVRKNIEHIVALKKQYRLSFRIAFNCVLNSENISKIESILNFCAQYEIDKISFANLVPRGRAKEMTHLITSPDQLIQAALIIAAYFNKCENSISIEPFFAPSLLADYICIKYNLKFPATSYRCRAGTEVGYIDERGRLYPCESIVNRYAIFNNSLVEHPFRDIWNSFIFNYAFQEVESGVEYTSKLCDLCKYRFTLCYPCINWSIKPKVCELIKQEIPNIFEVV